MTKNKLNELVLSILNSILKECGNGIPTRYGDPSLFRLLGLIAEANIPEFQFVNSDRSVSKRNLWMWITSRYKTHLISPSKLYGFVLFALRHSDIPDVRSNLQLLLNLKNVQSAIIKIGKGEHDMHALQNQLKVLEASRGEHYSYDDTKINRLWGFQEFHQDIFVNNDGKGIHTIKSHLVNLNKDELKAIQFPIFVEQEIPLEEIKPWAKSDEQLLHAQTLHWNGREGVIQILFDKSLEQQEKLRFLWGYEADSLFKEGNEYYSFGVNTSVMTRTGNIKFDSQWKFSNIRARNGILKSTSKIINYSTEFPQIGNHQVCFDLLHSA